MGEPQRSLKNILITRWFRSADRKLSSIFFVKGCPLRHLRALTAIYLRITALYDWIGPTQTSHTRNSRFACNDYKHVAPKLRVPRSRMISEDDLAPLIWSSNPRVTSTGFRRGLVCRFLPYWDRTLNTDPSHSLKFSRVSVSNFFWIQTSSINSITLSSQVLWQAMSESALTSCHIIYFLPANIIVLCPSSQHRSPTQHLATHS